MKQRLMALYFSEGGDLTDREVLVKAAADCGLDAARVRELLASDQDVDRGDGGSQFRQGGRHRRRPCFVFGALVAVSGAQAPEHLAQAIEAGGGRVRPARGAPNSGASAHERQAPASGLRCAAIPDPTIRTRETLPGMREVTRAADHRTQGA